MNLQYHISRYRKKMGRRLYRKLHGHPRWMDFPTTLQFNTQTRCNLQCIYCNPQGSFNVEHGVMPLETIEYVLKYFRGYDIDTVAPWANGDPLLEPRLPRIIDLAKKYIPKAKVVVFTNGVAYKNKWMLKNPKIDVIRFTISASTPETYELVHGKPFYYMALNTLEWVTLNKYPHQELWVNFIPVEANIHELRKWKERFWMYRQDVRPIHEGIGQLNSDAGKGSFTFEDARQISTNFKELQFSQDRPCSCWHNMTIDYNGNILHCIDAPTKYCIGKVGEDDLLEVWRRKQLEALDNPICRACNCKNPDWREIFARYRS
jgi:MoaA/NifB/PqqE/SkfB family radical SAM enzyme